jgi:hypothetical protein
MSSAALLRIKILKSNIELNYEYKQKCFLPPREWSVHYKNQLILPREMICDYSEIHRTSYMQYVSKYEVS